MCGEKNGICRAKVPHLGSPPRMRGKGHCRRKKEIRLGITPACAGKSVKVNEPDCLPRDHPRVCGEKRLRAAPSHPITGLPPRVRGKAGHAVPHDAAHRITPAYAGKRLMLCHRLPPCGDHPRVCGEKMVSMIPHRRSRGSPPRVRGKGACTGCSSA